MAIASKVSVAGFALVVASRGSAALALTSTETNGCVKVGRSDFCLEGEADGGLVVGPGIAGLKVMAREESDSQSSGQAHGRK